MARYKGSSWNLEARLFFLGLYVEPPALRTRRWEAGDGTSSSYSTSYSNEKYGRQKGERKERGEERTGERMREEEGRQA